MKNIILQKIKEYSYTDKIALNESGIEESFGKLEIISNNMAQYLRKKLNGKKQVPIVIYQKRGIKFIEFIIAVMKCNCYYIPFEDNTPLERVQYVCEDIRAEFVLTDSKNVKFEESCTIIDLPEGGDKTVFLETDDVEENDLVYVMYTSGTSGRPKGVKIKYVNLENLILSFNDILYYKFTHSINVGVMASFSFDASVKQIFNALYYGHTLCIANSTVKYFGRKIHSFHQKYNLTVCDLTPSHLKLMIMQSTQTKSHIPYLIVGGEKLSWSLLNQYVKFTQYIPEFINVYGPTECCVDVTYNCITENELIEHKDGDVPIGKPLKNTSIIIRGTSNEVIVEANKKGELCITGRQVGNGYVNIVSESFTQDSDEVEYHSGDIAYYNEEGDIIIVGRKDRQVKINGNRVELDEITKVIERYLNLMCTVIYIHKEDKDILGAYVVSDPISKKEKIGLDKYLKDRLPSYMIPNYFVFDNNLPLTSNGKIDEKKIRSLIEKKES